MAAKVDISPVDADSVAADGFFCRKSKMKTTGNQRKVGWATQEFPRGLGIEILSEDGRSKGFIEFIPGEHAWRAVDAAGYLFVHCIWVVGRAKGQGYGSRLLEKAEAAARSGGFSGVAMVTTAGVWLADDALLTRHGYGVVDEAPPSFRLVTKAFDGAAPTPRFPTDWAARAAAFGDGLTIVSTDQCPYLEDAERIILAGAADLGIPARVVKLETAADVQARAPSPYGVFGVVLDGELLSYHYLLEKDLAALVAARA